MNAKKQNRQTSTAAAAKAARLLSFALLAFSPTAAYADCATPTGVAGDLIYNSSYNVMQYCNGASWINMGSGVNFGAMTTGAFCTAISSTQVACTTTAINLATQVTGILPAANGGTGVNNGTSTITLGGALAFSGAYPVTFTATGTTSLTLPTTGNLLAYIGTAAQGDLLFYNGSNWARLGAGTSGQYLQTLGGSANPAWATVSVGTGSITGTLGVTQGGTGTAIQFTPGSVVFAGASGIYAQDNAAFFWDDGNKRLGIGTNAPLVALDLSANPGALALPVGTNGGRPTGGSLLNGLIRYNSSVPGVEAYINGAWTDLVSGSSTGTTTPAAGSDGEIQFNTGGKLNADSNLFWDNTGKRLGIGGTATTALTVIGTTTTTDLAATNVASTGTATLKNMNLSGLAAFQYGSDYVTAGSQSAVALGTATAVRYAGSAVATFYGLAAGSNGQIYQLTNASSYTLTLSNQSISEGTAANRIITGTAGDFPITSGSSVTLQYDATALRWRMIAASNSGVPAGTTGQVQFNSGSNTFAADSTMTWDNTNKQLVVGTGAATPVAADGGVASFVMNVIPRASTNAGSISTGGIALSTATLGQMAYFSGTNAISGTSQAYVGTNGIGVGTATSFAPLSLYSLSTSAPAQMIVDGVAGAVYLATNYNSSIGGGGLIGQFARGTYTSPTVVQADDRLAYFIGAAYTGTAFVNAAAIEARVGSGTIGTTSMPSYLAFHTTPTGTTTRAERMRIDSAGNVGIGTTGPDSGYVLDVRGDIQSKSTAAAITLQAASTESTLWLKDLTNSKYWQYKHDITNGNRLNIMYYNGSSWTAPVTVLASGNVGINTLSPASKLQVSGGEIQPGTSGATCASTNAGAIRWTGSAMQYCNGTAWTALGGASACSTADVQTFTSAGTWTKPSCGATTKIQCWGGGGGGSKYAGGGGGAYKELLSGTATLSATVAVTIGAGGTGGSGNGGNGGNSTFGSYVTAYGGGGAVYKYTGGGGGGMSGAANLSVSGSGNGGSQTGYDSTLGSCTAASPVIYGGGGGGNGDGGTSGCFGGATVYGGGGGGGGTSSSIAAGSSVFGGAGGTGGAVGNVPGGGGGGNYMVGAAGECIITTW